MQVISLSTPPRKNLKGSGNFLELCPTKIKLLFLAIMIFFSMQKNGTNIWTRRKNWNDEKPKIKANFNKAFLNFSKLMSNKKEEKWRKFASSLSMIQLKLMESRYLVLDIGLNSMIIPLFIALTEKMKSYKISLQKLTFWWLIGLLWTSLTKQTLNRMEVVKVLQSLWK